MKIIVYHAGYGCDTGCCGHIIECDGKSEFEFTHPDRPEDYRAWAEEWVRKKFGAEHVADLDWDNCHVTNDECY